MTHTERVDLAVYRLDYIKARFNGHPGAKVAQARLDIMPEDIIVEALGRVAERDGGAYWHEQSIEWDRDNDEAPWVVNGRTNFVHFAAAAKAVLAWTTHTSGGAA